MTRSTIQPVVVNSLLQDIAENILDNEFCNLTIILPNGEKFMTHRIFMVMRSPKIKRYLHGCPKLFRSTLSLVKVTGEIHLENADVSNAFMALRSYIYQDFIEWENVVSKKEIFIAVILLTKRLEIKHLVAPILKELQKYLAPATVVDFFNEINDLLAKEPPNDQAADKVFNEFMNNIMTACVDYLRNADALAEENFRQFKLNNLTYNSLETVLRTIYPIKSTEVCMLLKNVEEWDSEMKLRRDQEKKKLILTLNWTKGKTSETLKKMENDDILQYVSLCQAGSEIVMKKIEEVKNLSRTRYETAVEIFISNIVVNNNGNCKNCKRPIIDEPLGKTKKQTPKLETDF